MYATSTSFEQMSSASAYVKSSESRLPTHADACHCICVRVSLQYSNSTRRLGSAVSDSRHHRVCAQALTHRESLQNWRNARGSIVSWNSYSPMLLKYACTWPQLCEGIALTHRDDC